jgi:hypothetical protein
MLLLMRCDQLEHAIGVAVLHLGELPNRRSFD